MEINYTEIAYTAFIFDVNGRSLAIELSFSDTSWAVWLQAHGIIGRGSCGEEALKNATNYITNHKYLPDCILSIDDLSLASSVGIAAYNLELDAICQIMTGD